MKIQLFALMLLSFFNSCKEDEHIIKGEIASIDSKDTIYLLQQDPNDQFKGYKLIDSMAIKDNTFYFNPVLKNDSEIYVVGLKPTYIKNNNYYYDESSQSSFKQYVKIIVTSKKVNMKLEANFSNIVFKDSLNTSYYNFQKKIASYTLKSNPEINTIYSKMRDASTDNNTTLLNNAKTELRNLEHKITKSKEQFLKDYVATNKTAIGLLVFNDYLMPLVRKKTKEDISNLKKTLNSFDKYKLLPSYTKIKNEISIYEKCVIGGIFPALEGKNINGELEKLSDYKGKYVLLDFWFKNCKPCELEVPYLKKIHEKYKNKSLVVISYSIDSGDYWKKTVKEAKEMTWHHLSIPHNEYLDSMTKRLCIKSFPTLYLISPEGLVLENDLRQEKLVAAVKNNMSKE